MCGGDTLVTARPSNLKDHVETASHKEALAAKTQSQSMEQHTERSRRESGNGRPAVRDNLVGQFIAAWLASHGIPAAKSSSFMTTEFLAAIRSAPLRFYSDTSLRTYVECAVGRIQRYLGQHFMQPNVNAYSLLIDGSQEAYRGENISVVVMSTVQGMRLIDVASSHSASSGSQVAGILNAVVSKYELSPTGLVSIGGDNVAYNATAVTELGRLTNSTIRRARCGSHTMELLVQGFVKPFSRLLQVLSFIQKYVKKGNFVSARVQRWVAVVGNQAVLQWCATRWSSTLTALQELSLRLPLIQRFVLEECDWRARAADKPSNSLIALGALFQNEGAERLSLEVSVIQLVVGGIPPLILRSQGDHLLAPFTLTEANTLRAIRRFAREFTPATQLVGEDVWQQFTRVLRRYAPQLHNRIEELSRRSGAAANTIAVEARLGATSLLDKWERNEFDLTLQTAERHSLLIPAAAARLAAEVPPTPLLTDQAILTAEFLGVPAIDAVLQGQWHTYTAAIRQFSRATRETIPAPNIFWAAQGERMPQLALIAQRLLSIPFSIASAERVFSMMSRIQQPQRSSQLSRSLAFELILGANRDVLMAAFQREEEGDDDDIEGV